ncbi:hypothetical protein ES703_04238 [subsurface metagenome]
MKYNESNRIRKGRRKMPGKDSDDTSSEAAETLLQSFPRIFDRLVPEIEILTGKKFEPTATRINLKSLERKLRKLLTVVRQVEKVSGEILTPKSAKKRLELLNRMIRLTVPRIPRNEEPVEYLIQEVERQSKVPSGFVLPQGLDYQTKHLEFKAFVSELMASVDKSRLNAFLESSFTERQLISQFQRVFSKMSLPKELERPPVKITAKSIERLKLGLRDVTADWDALMNLLYGLVLLKRGRVPIWSGVRRVSLWNKVGNIRQEPRLVTLASEEWVTVRNSIGHGWAYYDPAKESIEFPNRTRRGSWSVERAFLEGIDIYLANSTILRTWNFVQTANLQSFKEQVAQLKALAQQ